MTDSRVNDSTPNFAKTNSQGALSQASERDHDSVKSPLSAVYSNTHEYASLHATSSIHKSSVPANDASTATCDADIVVTSPECMPKDTLNKDAASEMDLDIAAKSEQASAQLDLPQIDALSEGSAAAQELYVPIAQNFAELVASMVHPVKDSCITVQTIKGLSARTPAVLSSESSDQGIVYEWDFWRPHEQYLTDTLLPESDTVPEQIQRYRHRLLASCGLVAQVLAQYELLQMSAVTLYAFSASVGNEVHYRYQPDVHPRRFQSPCLQQNLYYPTYALNRGTVLDRMDELAALLGGYFDRDVLPTELEFSGVGDVVGVGRFENPFSFSYEVFESYERIRIQTRSTAWMTCDLTGVPQMALYSANGWRLERAMTDLVFFLGQQGFQLEQNRRGIDEDLYDTPSVCHRATRYADWDGDYLVNRSSLEPVCDELLNVVDLFHLNVAYAAPL